MRSLLYQSDLVPRRVIRAPIHEIVGYSEESFKIFTGQFLGSLVFALAVTNGIRPHWVINSVFNQTKQWGASQNVNVIIGPTHTEECMPYVKVLINQTEGK